MNDIQKEGASNVMTFLMRYDDEENKRDRLKSLIADIVHYCEKADYSDSEIDILIKQGIEQAKKERKMP